MIKNQQNITNTSFFVVVAFIGVEHSAVLWEQNINENYVIEKYDNSTMIIQLHKDASNIKIRTEVKKRDMISPKLFTLYFEIIFQKTSWEIMEITIIRDYLNHRWFTDVLLISKVLDQLQEILMPLNKRYPRVVLKMNRNKTNVQL